MPCVPFAQAADAFLGTWRQTFSEGGNCPTCTITITRNRNTFVITSNNGWAATAPQDTSGHLSGNGNWATSGAYAGPFKVDLEAAQQELRFRMRAENSGASFGARFAR